MYPNYNTLDPQNSIAQEIANSLTWYSPQFSPKDVPRFYDISSITEAPKLFRKVIDIMSQRYESMGEAGPTHILGFDARGFLLGPPIALELQIPFVMMRKAEKSPGLLIKSQAYHKEYAEENLDTMAIRVGSIEPNSRVVLIDDLIATGGTAISGLELVQACGAQVLELAAVIEIPFLKGIQKIKSYDNGKYRDTPIFTLIHDNMITEQTCGDPTTWDATKSRVINSPELGYINTEATL